MTRTSLVSLSLVLCSLVMAQPAVADEAYVCDANRIVYVKPGELEHLKRTDACIAGYYGLTIDTTKTDKTGKPDQKPAKADGKLPVPPGGAAKGLEMEREARAAATTETGSIDKAAPAAAVAKKHAALPKAVSAKPATDFRNVLIINAAPGIDPIYRHDK